MRILSWDIGTKNLAYCLLEIDDNLLDDNFLDDQINDDQINNDRNNHSKFNI